MPAQGIEELIGAVPYRLAFAGGWIDQPFVSRLDPAPPGSMVVAGLRPDFRFLDRAGLATSTRQPQLTVFSTFAAFFSRAFDFSRTTVCFK